jgi:hypothetical protein
MRSRQGTGWCAGMQVRTLVSSCGVGAGGGWRGRLSVSCGVTLLLLKWVRGHLGGGHATADPPRTTCSHSVSNCAARLQHAPPIITTNHFCSRHPRTCLSGGRGPLPHSFSHSRFSHPLCPPIIIKINSANCEPASVSLSPDRLLHHSFTPPKTPTPDIHHRLIFKSHTQDGGQQG